MVSVVGTAVTVPLALFLTLCPPTRLPTAVLGHGGAGKTALLQAIDRGAAPVQGEMPRLDSTIGIDAASEQVVAAFHQLAPPANASEKVDLSIYDFAGQLEYLSTHQFFISTARTVALILIDVSLPVDQQKRHLDHWLGMLCSQMPRAVPGGKSPYRVQLVLTKADLLSHPIASARAADLQREANKQVHLCWTDSVLLVSNKSGFGVRQLAQRVQQAASTVLADMGQAILVPKYDGVG